VNGQVKRLLAMMPKVVFIPDGPDGSNTVNTIPTGKRSRPRLMALLASVLATAGLGLTGGAAANAAPAVPGEDPAEGSEFVVAAVAPAGALPTATAPDHPQGGLRNLALAQDVFAKNRGAVLGIDEAGWLWAYPSGPGGELGEPIVIGQDFGATDLYPADGAWLVSDGFATGSLSTHTLAGVTCDGDMFRYLMGYLEYSYSATRDRIGNGWTGYSVIPVGDVSGDDDPDLLAVKEATGDLFLYRTHSELARFYSPYPKVGNGWQDYKLLPGGDLSGDGRNDILGIDPAGDLYLYKGLGNGYFAKKVKVGNGWTSYDLMSGADIDGDGQGDIMGRADDGRLFFYRGLGGGKFATKVQVGTGWGPSGVTKDCSAPGSSDIGTMLPIPWEIPGGYLLRVETR
jgi:hypothetical protein